MDEAHVQHAVGLVQHKDLQLTDVDEALVVEIFQSAGSCNQNIAAGLQGFHLWVLPHAAKNDRTFEGEICPVSLHALLNLDGQFTGGGEDQSADGRAGFALRRKALKNGGRKGAGFTGSGARAPQHVPSRQRSGDGLFLDRRGRRITLLLQGIQDGTYQA